MANDKGNLARTLAAAPKADENAAPKVNRADPANLGTPSFSLLANSGKEFTTRDGETGRSIGVVSFLLGLLSVKFSVYEYRKENKITGYEMSMGRQVMLADNLSQDEANLVNGWRVAMVEQFCAWQKSSGKSAAPRLVSKGRYTVAG